MIYTYTGPLDRVVAHCRGPAEQTPYLASSCGIIERNRGGAVNGSQPLNPLIRGCADEMALPISSSMTLSSKKRIFAVHYSGRPRATADPCRGSSKAVCL